MSGRILLVFAVYMLILGQSSGFGQDAANKAGGEIERVAAEMRMEREKMERLKLEADRAVARRLAQRGRRVRVPRMVGPAMGNVWGAGPVMNGGFGVVNGLNGVGAMAPGMGGFGGFFWVNGPGEVRTFVSPDGQFGGAVVRFGF
jgi:hypothetical protein